MQNIKQGRGAKDEGRRKKNKGQKAKGKADLRVTLVQTSLMWEDIDANLQMFGNILSTLKNSTDLIILPEMFNTGFSMRASELAETMSGKTLKWLKTMAKETKSVITGSLMIRDRGKFYNRLIWMRPDGNFETYDKRHLFGLGDEHQYYSAGKKRLIVSLKNWTICPLVCYDLRFPVWCRNGKKLAAGGRQEAGNKQYDLLIFVANWPERRNFAWKHLLQARAIENQAYVVGVNRISNDGHGIYYSGDSSLIDPMGEVVFTQEDVPFTKTLTLSKERIQYVRGKMPFLEDGDEFKIQ